MKTLQGFKNKHLPEPVEWVLRHDKRAVFHRIEAVEEAKTPDGPMLVVRVQHKAELANPDTDVAVLVGQAIAYRRSGVRDPQSPELWFWADKFWVKAKASDGSDYYRSKCYLFYEVQVKDQEQLMHEITTGFEQA